MSINEKNNLLAFCKDRMKNHRISHIDTDIDSEDTGAIVAIIIYFIACESNVNHSKLEYYLLLLNWKCLSEKGQNLFKWKLNSKLRIGKFKKILDFMMEKELISKNGRSQFYILAGSSDILKNTKLMLMNIEQWLITILNDFSSKNATQMKEELLKLGVIKDK